MLNINFKYKYDTLWLINKSFLIDIILSWNTERCRSEYDPIQCTSNRSIAEYFNVKILTHDHLNEYRKQFFNGPKINYTICTEADLSVVSPVKEFWK